MSILRLSSVIAMDPLANLRFSDAFYFRALVPEDTRVHTVDPAMWHGVCASAHH
jgi:hypothetical protein